jgi:enoyl-CoA hydratase/carnithine racemase
MVHVIVTDAGCIRTIRMNRPNKKNALTLSMYEAMTAALERAPVTQSFASGVPAAFSAGNGLADFLNAAMLPACPRSLRQAADGERSRGC